MSLKLITAPSGLAVSLVDAKVQLRVTGTDEDALITRLIKGATARAEHETGRAVMDQEWELIVDAFPAAEIELALPPVKIHCSVLAEDAIKAAIADYQQKNGITAGSHAELAMA